MSLEMNKMMLLFLLWENSYEVSAEDSEACP